MMVAVKHRQHICVSILAANGANVNKTVGLETSFENSMRFLSVRGLYLSFAEGKSTSNGCS